MSTLKVQIRGWKRHTLIVLLVIGGVWGSLKWAEKQFARFQYKKSDECVGYEFHRYRAFSPLRIFPLDDHPTFIRVIEKNWPRNRGNWGLLDNDRAIGSLPKFFYS